MAQSMRTKERTMPIVTIRNQGENDRDFLDHLHNLGKLLTVKELARILAISEKTIYGYVSRNMIPYLKIQSSVRFRPKHIVQWLTHNDVSAERMKKCSSSSRGHRRLCDASDCVRENASRKQ